MGTLPLEVAKYASALKRGVAATDYVEEAFRAAKRDLAAFAHQRILKELRSSPDGVSTDKFCGVFHDGVNLAAPQEVAVAMKKKKAIVYHLPSGEYRLASRAHRTALLERKRDT